MSNLRFDSLLSGFSVPLFPKPLLQNVNKIERRERIRASVTKQLNANPELKEAYRKLVKNLPAEQQEKAMATIAARTLRTIMPRKQTTGARV
jgi:hypothetical protein